MKKIFRKNNKLTVILRSEASSGSYQLLNNTPSRSDSEHTQSSQTNNVGWAYLPNITKLAQTAALTLAMSFFITQSAIAAESTPATEDNTAYTLTRVEEQGINTITKYEWSQTENKFFPVYYRVDLKDSIKNIGSGDTTKYFEWVQNTETGNLEFKEVSAPTTGKNTITVKYNSGNIAQPIENSGAGQTIDSVNNDYISGDGAISNTFGGTIGEIKGNFINNDSNPFYGVIHNSSYELGYINNATINNISGNFIGNKGGAIYNTDIDTGEGPYGYSLINNISGTFIGNNNDFPEGGGAIRNISHSSISPSIINNITGDFIGNYVSNRQNIYTNGGGAISNIIYYGGIAQINSINGNFIGNYAALAGNHSTAYGGAIYNKTNIYYNSIDGSSIIGTKDKDGNLTGGIVNSNFWGNHATATGENAVALGGAIYTDNSLNIIAKDGGQSIFSGNYTESNGVKTPNAIYVATISDSYTNTDRNIISIDNTKVTFEEITKAEAPLSVPTLTLDANTNGVIVFDNTIDGNIVVAGTNTVTKTGDLVLSDYAKDDFGVSTIDQYIKYAKEWYLYDEDTTDEEIINKGIMYGDLKIDNEKTLTESQGDKYTYTLALDGDSTGKVVLNNDIINANISLDNTNLYLGREDVFDKSQSLTLNSGSIYLNNNTVGTMHIPTLNLNGNTNISVDADLANKSMDRITADSYNVKDGAMLNVNNVVLLSDAKEDVTNIQFADDELATNVAFTGTSPIAYSPIWKYDVSYNPDDGFFSFTRGGSGAGGNASDAFNPSVLASPVATQAGAYTTQLQTFNYAFQHADTFMNIPYLERVAIINQGKYALSPTGDATDVGTYSPLLLKEESAGFWVKPYASFENVPLKNGPKVSNINYGTLVGYDSPLQSISNGFERVLTGYIGYNGASQRYSGVDAYQNGGLLGGTATFYKGNFFNATTLSVGASAGDASTMYGSENYTMLLAGLGNKTGYNFEFFDGGMILQPSMLISYTFVNTFDYTNGAGVRIESDPMHAIQLAPGIKLIGNTKNGWQPYIGVSMVWNLLDESKVTADSVRLPEMSIKPYVQYGVGLQKRVNDKFLAFGQAMIHNGGRNGVSLSAGLRWKIGRE